MRPVFGKEYLIAFRFLIRKELAIKV
jgi:hypothetical protein